MKGKNGKMNRLFLFFALFLFFQGPVSLGRAVVDRVVAVVNQEIITLSEVEKWTHPLKQNIVTKDRLEKQDRVETLSRQVLERLIEEKLIDQEVKKSAIKISSKEIEATLEEVKQRNAINQEGLERALAAEGLTLEAYKEEIGKTLQRKRLIGWAVKVEVKDGEKELREFYQKNIDRYRTNEAFHLSHILLIIPKEATPEGTGEIRKKAQKVLERIKEGEDFGEMALLYSEDASGKNRGDLGYFKRGELFPAFERELMRLKVGEVSGIIQSELGFHIIKLLNRIGMDPFPFEEVRERVKADYFESEMDKAVKQYVSTLKEKAIIEIKL